MCAYYRGFIAYLVGDSVTSNQECSQAEKDAWGDGWLNAVLYSVKYPNRKKHNEKG